MGTPTQEIVKELSKITKNFEEINASLKTIASKSDDEPDPEVKREVGYF